MAAKGTIAKQAVIDKIAAALGEDFIGEYDKKIYVWSKENGEKMQIAISMTCPKTPIDVGATPKTASTPGMMDFEAGPAPKIEMTEQEKENIEALMARLGL